ncbi:MAG: hypothetical protein IJH95_04165 [Mogibacterium sp.]|nr:hypothetical protein [Mogibacterium sp.]
MRKDSFGINIKQYCRAHEKSITAAMSKNGVTSELVELHREKIAIVQHERLVHLIVTVMVVFVELFTVDLVLLHPEKAGIPGAIVMLGLAVLLGFYFYHYFFLENTVQRWYRLLDEMRKKEAVL